jgi:hypothetical protein
VSHAAETPALEPIQSVTIGANHEYRINGKPFLPIFGWLQKPATLPKLKEIGFNTISGYWREKDGTGDLKTADQYGEAAWKAGLYFIPHYESKYPAEMERLKGAPYLLFWFQADEPDLPKKTSDAVLTASNLKINSARPLTYLADGDPKTSCVLSPMAGAEVTIRYPKPATVSRFALGNGPDGIKASEVAVLVEGKEICRATLPNTTEMKSVPLASPVALQELTLKVLAQHEPPAPPAGQPAMNWGTFAGVDGFDAAGVNVLQCALRKGPQQSGEETLKVYNETRRFDSSRPILLTFSSMFLEDLYDKSWYTREQAGTIYPTYVGCADVYGIDIYPIFGWNQPENIHWVSKATLQQRALVGPDRPLFQWIETCSGPFGDKAKPVTGLEIRNEVYQALASGCTAIGYFTHVFKPKFAAFGVSPENQEAIKKINAEITTLAPALLGPVAKQQPELVIEGGVRSLCRATSEAGKMTVIAINMDGKYQGGAGTIKCPGLKEGTEITVLGENRTLKSAAGEWKDDFSPLAVHLYALKL